MRKMKLLFGLSLSFFFTLSLSSETVWKDYTRWSIGAEIGGNAFDGDIRIVDDNTHILNFPSVGAYVEYGINPILSGGLAYNYHRIYANNQLFRFTSKMHQVYPYFGVNFVNLFVRENQSKWDVWGTVGFGIASYTSDKQKNIGTKEDPIYQDYAHLKNKHAVTIPVSLLVEYNLTDHLALNMRYQYAGFNRDDIEGGGPEYKDTFTGVTNDYVASLSLGVRWKFVGKKQHVRNVDMATYLPICCVEPVEVKPDSTLYHRLDSLADRLAELEKRPEPPAVVEEEEVVVVVPPVRQREVIVVFERTMYGINFETDKDIIKPESYPILDNVVMLLEEFPYYNLMIKGHTDDVGGKEYNIGLSQRRAKSVKQYMVEAGIPEERITTEGYGDTQPVANNNTAYGRRRNRRVDFVVSYEKREMESLHSLPEEGK